MMKIWRHILASALVLAFLTSACGILTRSPSDRNNDSAHLPTRVPAATATPAGISNVPLIPITGENVVFMQCQFCVGQETHVVLIFPDSAYFDVDRSSPATCLTADVVNGRRILICRGPQSTSFNLSICSDPSNCLQFPVALQPCDLLQGSVPLFPPVYLTPNNSSASDDDDAPTQPASTAVPPPLTNPPTNPPEPPKEPKPTNEPKPTKESKPTKEPKATKPPKPTKNKP